MNQKILIIGYGSETTIRFFIKQLNAKNAKYQLFDLDKLIEADHIDVFYQGPTLNISFAGGTFCFQDFVAFYCRYYYLNTSVQERNELFSRCLQCINSWLLNTDKVVVNRPGAGSSNSSKLAHILDLQDCGFKIPFTYIFGDGKIAGDLLAADKEWVSKGCSSYRTRAKLLTEIQPLDLSLLNYAPSQFQEFIRGVDVRLHVVGDQVVGLKIISTNTDYRYDTAENMYEIFTPPDSIVEACHQYCAKEGLTFAGFDFKIDANDQYFILEANPMPGYEFFDRRLGGKISDMLYQLLIRIQNPQLSLILSKNKPFIGPERRKKFH